MSKQKPVSGQPVQFRFKGKDGQWYNLEEGDMKLIDIELPDTSELDKKFKPVIDKLVERKSSQAVMRHPTAQDALMTHMMLFSEDFWN